jgi:uncharacterized membrane protein YiaA
MSNAPVLQVFGWLIFVWGVALMLIAVRPSKEQVRSPTARLAGVLGGAVFCLLAAIPLWGSSGTLQKGFFIAAIVAGTLSWYLARHARKLDRANRASGLPRA